MIVPYSSVVRYKFGTLGFLLSSPSTNNLTKASFISPRDSSLFLNLFFRISKSIFSESLIARSVIFLIHSNEFEFLIKEYAQGYYADKNKFDLFYDKIDYLAILKEID